ncbi:FAD/NAD(P)-binding protein [Variovorax sp. 350MFTsu5.1]|uniref:FAD/NAD(P)-binding protein n=1 Tax=Variovorax sp. 350MFTsu5.1 TaxID=3158365 RepID=UPI003AAD6A45
MRVEIAIVGAGPWGLAVLDRLVTASRQQPRLALTVHVIDPDEPGPGLHKPQQEDFLLLNTVTGQLDSFSACHFGEAPLTGAMSFIDWLREERDIAADPNGFLPRALFGAYLRHVYAVLCDNAPSHLRISEVRHRALDVSLVANERVHVRLGDGSALTVDHVFLCTGHGLARSGGERPASPARPMAPYPPAPLQARIEAGSAVGISGTGLVAVDVVAALTTGRGGRFVREDDGVLQYLPSGREPVMFVHSRSGMPFACRPAQSLDLSGSFAPIFCTDAYLALRRAARGPEGLLLEEDLLTVLSAEMRAAYLMRAMALSQGADAAAACRGVLGLLAPAEVKALCEKTLPSMAGFSPETLLASESVPRPAPSPRSGAEFSAAFAARLRFDVDEARKGEAHSPYKYAVEMLRVLRGFIRQAVEFDTLAPASRRRFFDVVAPRISQLVVGPPISRGLEWLALMRAGLLRVDLGPAPALERDAALGVWRARSSAFETPFVACLDHLVHGRAGYGAIDTTDDSLLAALCRSGLCAGSSPTPPADERMTVPLIDALGHPVDATGLPVRQLTLLGVPTEGRRYFNHYLPSPRSRSRAFDSIQSALDALWERPAPQIVMRQVINPV